MANVETEAGKSVDKIRLETEIVQNRRASSNGVDFIETNFGNNSAQLEDALVKSPLDRDAVNLAVSSIPKERHHEMLEDMLRAGSSTDIEVAKKTLAHWVMIGAFYADPDREENHPLKKIFGAFKNEPQWDALMNDIAERRDKSESPGS